MTIPKLTPTMREALEAVQRGDVYACTVYKAFSMKMFYQGAHSSSIILCRQHNLIKADAGSDHLTIRFELTEAGRKALEESK